MHSEPTRDGFRAWTVGGECQAVGVGKTPPDAAINLVENAAKLATWAANANHAKEIDRIKQLATLPAEDPRDARIKELERSLAEQKEFTAMVEAQLEQRTKAVYAALGLS